MLRPVLIAVILALTACGLPAPDGQTERSISARDIEIEAPAANARVTSPLLAAGTAQNSWYFEAVFPAKLVGADGAVIAEAPAIAATDWTQAGPVPFNVEMSFTVETETPATLVLEEDMPRDVRTPRRVEIPVTLLPGAQ